MFMRPLAICHRMRVRRHGERGGAPIVSSARAAMRFMSAMGPRRTAGRPLRLALAANGCRGRTRFTWSADRIWC